MGKDLRCIAEKALEQVKERPVERTLKGAKESSIFRSSRCKATGFKMNSFSQLKQTAFSLLGLIAGLWYRARCPTGKGESQRWQEIEATPLPVVSPVPRSLSHDPMECYSCTQSTCFDGGLTVVGRSFAVKTAMPTTDFVSGTRGRSSYCYCTVTL